jgi:hypothetical protein
MNLTKNFLIFSIVVVVSFLGWSGCYTQLATNSDNPGPTVDSPTTGIDQPPPVEPYYPLPTETYYPHTWYPPTSAGSTSTVTGTDSPQDSPHRQSGYQRSPSTDQNNSRQTDATPSRTSWSPAPAPTPSAPTSSAPTPGSDSSTRTSGSTRGGR